MGDRWRGFLALAWFCAMDAWAGGPRFITGTANGNPGVMEAFYTPRVTYFTDAGALAATVTHTQADAMVAAAAAVWNVPTANLTLSQGGELAEHVSGANAYFNGTTLELPPDVMATNYLNAPIAVIYDADGSVTELLLGEGASDPSGCRQHGVTESVDGFGATGTIEHALIVLNGRCVGSNAQQLMQMQYQVMRAFGRVLGLAWSQVNDNVFTGSPAPTAGQMAHWPVMHPMDVICGPYTYQCMQNPFTLRMDDVSALSLLYPVTASGALPGKVPVSKNGMAMQGWASFATGQGMELLNMAVIRAPSNGVGWEGWESVSGVSGVVFQQNGGNPVSGPEPAAYNAGSPYGIFEGMYYVGMVPLEAPYMGLWVRPEAINPLYVGEYAVGPYQRVPASMTGAASGSAYSPFAVAGPLQYFWSTMSDEPAGCAPGADGTEAAPAAADASGWWNGPLCGVGHSSWWSTSVKAGRSWTLETTALDESGNATLQKAQPLVGLWNASDATGTLPTVGAQTVAMNAPALGVTQLRLAAGASDASYRMVVADQFGAGRPDFAYKARVLCVDGVSPNVVPVDGGQITLTGRGFRMGNQVLVNGVAATVTTWTATQIVATVPTQKAAGAAGAAVDVEVRDASTGGVSDVAGALMYSGASAAGPASQVVVLGEGAQSIAVGAVFALVVLKVLDSQGNSVAGAMVSVYQTVYAWEGVCPAVGPCAAAPVLKAAQATMVSGADGTVSVTPLQVAGQAQTVEMAATVGTVGFVSVDLVVSR